MRYNMVQVGEPAALPEYTTTASCGYEVSGELCTTRTKPNFSKLLLLCLVALSVVLCAVCVMMKVVFHDDVTDLTTIAAASFAIDGTWGGFYFWKAKNENRAKYAQEFVREFAEEHGIDAAIRLAEVVLKD